MATAADNNDDSLAQLSSNPPVAGPLEVLPRLRLLLVVLVLLLLLASAEIEHESTRGRGGKGETHEIIESNLI